MSLVEEWESAFEDTAQQPGQYAGGLYSTNYPVSPTTPFSGANLGGDSYDAVSSGGFVKPSLTEEETPIFQLEKMKYTPRGLSHLCVCNGVMVMMVESGHLVRLDADSPVEVVEAHLPHRTPDERVHKLFLDPTGNHTVVSMNTGENYYMHSSWHKPKYLSRLKGTVIECIGWDAFRGNDLTSKEVLLGTSNGSILEIVFETKERNVRPVYVLQRNTPVTSISVKAFPGSGDSPKFVVMATTPRRIYQFIGGPTFESVFTNPAYEANPPFIELGGNLPYSELQLYGKFREIPSYFAWLTEPGVYHGRLVFRGQGPGDSVQSDTGLLPHAPDYAPTDDHSMSMALTEYHFLLLVGGRLIALCQLNGQVVLDEDLCSPSRASALGAVKCLYRDPIRGVVWMGANNAILKIQVTNEDRDIWQLYLDQGQFEAALGSCKDVAQRDKVLCAQADHHYANGNMDVAAQFYAKTHKNLEDVALSFVNKNDNEALMTYLLHKLDNLHANDKTQMTVISMWIVQLYLDRLDKSDSVEMKEEFQHFLEDNKSSLHVPTTLELMASHGRSEELLHFAHVVGDHGRAIAHHIQRGNYHDALACLSHQSDDDLFYQHSPTLMRHVPSDTVDAWIRGSSVLDPRRLLPGLIEYEHVRKKHGTGISGDQAIRYLRHCIHKLGSTDTTLHNYLLSLYVDVNDDGSALIAFINGSSRQFDLQYALRLCNDKGKKLACVHIYAAMEQYEEALELCLQLNNEALALEIADMPETDDTLKHKLWLRVARHVVETEHDFKKAMELVSKCDFLRIEYVLPFFPPFNTISDFKDEICRSLSEYNDHIAALREDMDEATHSAELLRGDVKDVNAAYEIVESDNTCGVCKFPAATREFFVFPCQHAFHKDCLQSELMGRMNSAQKRVLEDAMVATEQPRSPSSTTATARGGAWVGEVDLDIIDVPLSESEHAQRTVTSLLSRECPWCSEMAIRQVEAPMVPIDTLDAWKL